MAKQKLKPTCKKTCDVKPPHTYTQTPSCVGEKKFSASFDSLASGKPHITELEKGANSHFKIRREQEINLLINSCFLCNRKNFLPAKCF